MTVCGSAGASPSLFQRAANGGTRDFQHLFNGLSTGSVLIEVALGWAIIFGQMGVTNMAHGKLMMMGVGSGNFLWRFEAPMTDAVAILEM